MFPLFVFFQSALSHSAADAVHESTVSVFWILPFIILLLMIATGPLFYARFWHKYYAHVSILIGGFVVGYYLIGLGRPVHVAHTISEYVQFISLLTALYFASSSIQIVINRRATPRLNVLFLFIGSVMANLIGTTGASMLLIRPYMILNRDQIRPYHVVFFIFSVSNIGGSLTPIGDPPLFLGYLKGVPFFWNLQHNILPWALAMVLVLGVFYVIDLRNYRKYIADKSIIAFKVKYVMNLFVRGRRSIFWLALVIVMVFFDPNIFPWLPAIPLHGARISFVREIVFLLTAFFSYKYASKKVLLGNGFSFFPIKEVALVFIGIFCSMMPALELVNQYASSDAGRSLFNPSSLYWGTGLLSGFLDNAPTYLSFLTAAMAVHGGSISSNAEVLAYATETGAFIASASSHHLQAIALSSVFFGAMTYIGNGPNFMVRAIARQQGIAMPYFFAYIVRYSVPILLPIYFLIWLIFIAG